MNHYMRYPLLLAAALAILLASAVSPILAEERRIHLEGLHQRKDEKIVNEWIQDLRTGSVKQQLTALGCLGDYGREAVTAIALIRERLKDSNSLIRRQALAALVKVYEDDFKYLMPVSEQESIAQMDREPLTAAYSLSKLATANSLQTISNSLSNDDLVVRCFSLKSIGRILRSDGYTNDNQDQSVPPAVLAAIWRDQAKVCLEPMIRLLHSDNPWLQENSAETIAEMTGDNIDIVSPAVPVFIEIIKVADNRLVSHVASALYRIGKPAAASAPVLIEAFKRSESSKDEFAEWGLESHQPVWSILRAVRIFGPASRESGLSTAKHLCGHPIPMVREEALSTLVSMGALADMVDEFITALQDSEPKVRQNAAYELRKAGNQGAKVVPALVKALEDKDKDVRFSACCGIRDLAKYAADARPVLKRLAADDDKLVRAVAEEALRAVQREYPE